MMQVSLDLCRGYFEHCTPKQNRTLSHKNKKIESPSPTSAQKLRIGRLTVDMSTNDMRENQDCRICYVEEDPIPPRRDWYETNLSPAY